MTITPERLATCPDCGSPMEWNQKRDIGPPRYKQEVAASYLYPEFDDGVPAEDRVRIRRELRETYDKMPEVLGREIGQTHLTETCTGCLFERIDGQVTRRSNP